MKSSLSFLFISFFACVSSALIYGVDDRREISANPQLEKLASAVALMVPLNFVSETAGGLQIEMKSLSDTWGLCSSERFATQKVSAVACTGFLIAPDILVTAGHCAVNWARVENAMTPQCEAFGWLFDDRLDSRNGAAPSLKNVPPERFARCKSVIYANQEVETNLTTQKNTYGEDIAFIRLDRPMTNRTNLVFADRSAEAGERVSTMGHPVGLPLKAVASSLVFDSSPKEYVRAFLDTQGGASGSPVLNSENQVVGVLVRSFPDADIYTPAGATCGRMNRCDDHGKNCLSSENDLYEHGSEIQRIPKRWRKYEI